MNRHERRAEKRVHRATWRLLAGTVAKVIGANSPLYTAAMLASRNASDPDDAVFWEEFYLLEPEDQFRLHDAMDDLASRSKTALPEFLRAGQI